jgi:DNA-binding response OmpR family regulator
MADRTFEPTPEPGPFRSLAGPPRPADSVRPKVLVVEDDADLRAYLLKHLVPHCDFLEAACGDEGLQMARAEMPDVVVADILMPGLDGYELCRALKSTRETEFIPVILMSVNTDLRSRIDAYEAGADHYLTKPFEPAELILCIRNLEFARAHIGHYYASRLGRRLP